MRLSSIWENKVPLSLDTVLLMVLIVSYLNFNQVVSALIVLVVSLYALGDWFLLLRSGTNAGNGNQMEIVYKIKFFLLALVIGIAVVGPTIYHIVTRPSGEADAHLHDGAFQIEVALRYLTNGKNPYAETYFGTGLENYILTDAPENPALYNFVYFPLLLWISFPFYWLLTHGVQWYDQRLIYLASFILLVFLLTRLTNNPARKLTLLILLTLNNYSSGALEQGFNDWIVLLFLVTTVLFLKRGEITLASLTLGLACATKPSAWFVIPFVALFIVGNFSFKLHLRFWTRQAIATWIIPWLTVIPFLIWDSGAFYRSTIGYILGLDGSVPYPIRGFGIGTWLLALGIVSSPQSYFPFWILQAIVGIPMLVVLSLYQVRNNSINAMLLCYATFFVTMTYLSRFFQGNYLLFGIWIFLLAGLTDSFHFRSSFNQTPTGLVT